MNETRDNSFRRIGLRLSALAVLCLSVAPLAGCFTFNEEHNKEHMRKIRQQFEDVHEEIDAYFFDLDDRNPDNY